MQGGRSSLASLHNSNSCLQNDTQHTHTRAHNYVQVVLLVSNTERIEQRRRLGCRMWEQYVPSFIDGFFLAFTRIASGARYFSASIARHRTVEDTVMLQVNKTRTFGAKLSYRRPFCNTSDRRRRRPSHVPLGSRRSVLGN